MGREGYVFTVTRKPRDASGVGGGVRSGFTFGEAMAELYEARHEGWQVWADGPCPQCGGDIHVSIQGEDLVEMNQYLVHITVEHPQSYLPPCPGRRASRFESCVGY